LGTGTAISAQTSRRADGRALPMDSLVSLL
jgi:hypothetical protein